MSLEEQIPFLQNAIWKRLEGKTYLTPTGLLARLGGDTGMHPQDVRRGLARLRELGWLDGVALNGEPIGRVTVLEERPSAAVPVSLLAWMGALGRCDLTIEDRECLATLHTLLDGFADDDMVRLADGMLRLRAECRTNRIDSQFLISARNLLGSSKLLGVMPAATLKKFVGRELEFAEQIPYIVTAGPRDPASVILIENPWAFERAVELGLAETHALVITFGYGLARNGEAFGRQLAQQIEVDRPRLIQLRRHGNPPDLESLFCHSQLSFWGDLDPEGLRIYMRLKRRLPSLRISKLYEPMHRHLVAAGGHPYHIATGKEGQIPISSAELQDFPEIVLLAKACERYGLDQEALSAQDITAIIDT